MAQLPAGGEGTVTNPIGTWPVYKQPSTQGTVGAVGLPGFTNPPRQSVAGAASATGLSSTGWHMVVLWFLGAMALLALASPAPNVATMIVVLLIVAQLLAYWPQYGSYLGLFGSGNLTNPTQQKAAPSALSNS